MCLQRPRFDVLESLGFSLRQELVNDDLKRDLIEKARGVVKDWWTWRWFGKDIIEEGPQMSQVPDTRPSMSHLLSFYKQNHFGLSSCSASTWHGAVQDTINRHKTRENAREELAEFKARLNRAKEDAGHSPAGTE